MRRRLLNLLTLLSLALFMVVVALWVRSYWASTSLVKRQAAVEGGETRIVVYDLHSTRGGIVFHYLDARMPVAAAEPQLAQILAERVRRSPEYRGSTFGGEAWNPYTVFPPGQYHLGFLLSNTRRAMGAGTEHMIYLVFPHWAAASLLAVLPALWLLTARRRRRTRRQAAGLCIACGYDLRATPGRCPECGKESPAIISN